MSKRSEIFTSLIISRLLFGSETWYIGDKGTKHYLHCSIMRLYKRMLGGSRNDNRSDAEVLHLTGLPDPAVLLRLRRLRYLSSLLSSGASAHWGLLNRDHHWLALLRDDLQWTWDQLCSSCDLGNPQGHTARWLEIIIFHRGYWRRILRRARQHAILVHSRHFLCMAAHYDVKHRLQESGQHRSSLCPLEPALFWVHELSNQMQNPSRRRSTYASEARTHASSPRTHCIHAMWLLLERVLHPWKAQGPPHPLSFLPLSAFG